MLLEVVLAVIAVTITVIATVSDNLPAAAKRTIVGLAIVVAVGSGAKAYNDQREKEILKAALLATLAPPTSAYQLWNAQIDKAGIDKGYRFRDCYHTSEGLACFSTSGKAGAFVADRYDVAQMYANLINKVSNAPILHRLLDHRYTLDEMKGHEFRNKAALLGEFLYFKRLGRYPIAYNYDDDQGVQLYADTGNRKPVVTVTPEEFQKLPIETGPVIFNALGQLYQVKLASLPGQAQDCTPANSP